MSSQNYEKFILGYLVKDAQMTLPELALKMGLSLSTIKREVSKLQSYGKLVRYGNNRRGLWKVKA